MAYMGEPAKADETDCKMFGTHLNFGDKKTRSRDLRGFSKWDPQELCCISRLNTNHGSEVQMDSGWSTVSQSDKHKSKGGK